MFNFSHYFITSSHNIFELLSQRGWMTGQFAAALALQPVDADIVNSSNLVKHRAVPVDMIDERPPGISDHGNAFRTQPLHVAHGLVQPLQALAFIAVKARFSDHQRDAVAFPIISDCFV